MLNYFCSKLSAFLCIKVYFLSLILCALLPERILWSFLFHSLVLLFFYLSESYNICNRYIMNYSIIKLYIHRCQWLNKITLYICYESDLYCTLGLLLACGSEYLALSSCYWAMGQYCFACWHLSASINVVCNTSRRTCRRLQMTTHS